MNYEKFRDLFIEKIKERVGDNIKVKTNTVTKNNGKLKEGLIVETGNTLLPMIYLDELYEKYNQNGIMEEILETVISLINGNPNNIKERVETLINGGWDKIKDTIEVCVINKEWNKDKLENIPHIEYLDLALVFRVVIYREEDSSMSCLMTNSLLNKLQIDIEEFKNEALSRLNSSYYYIQTLTGVIKECMQSEDEEEMFDSIIENSVCDVPLYVLTNKQRLNGAAGIARVDIINKFANEMEDDLYILPSSLHELLLLPAKENCSVDELREMVRSVNESEVDKEDWLSDNIYFFNRERGSLEIAV